MNFVVLLNCLLKLTLGVFVFVFDIFDEFKAAPYERKKSFNVVLLLLLYIPLLYLTDELLFV